MLDHVFGPPEQWPLKDMIGWTQDLTPGLALAAYRSGVFPMPLHIDGLGQAMSWWSPVRRGILPLDGLRVTRSLRKSARRYTTSVNAAFDQVIRRCGDPSRPDGWIDDDIVAVFTELYRLGWVHSVETWDDEGRLVGGLYGVSIGGLFAGESMFHDAEFGRDASKVALVRLVEELEAGVGAGALLDVQWRTDHLATLGVVEVPRSDYLALLDDALQLPQMAWPQPSPVSST